MPAIADRGTEPLASLSALSHQLSGILASPTFWLLTPIILFEVMADALARRRWRRK